MNLNDLNHASLTSCDQDASSKLLCRYRLIRAARNYHHGGIVTTEPDRPRARPLRLAGWLLAQASACPPSESFRFWWLSLMWLVSDIGGPYKGICSWWPVQRVSVPGGPYQGYLVLVARKFPFIDWSAFSPSPFPIFIVTVAS